MAKGLRQLAAETGFSIATISRALNNSASVTAQTRETILEAARRLGYTPNAAARALSTARTKTIGAVIPTLEHSIFSTFINAIEDTLAKSGYVLVIATTDNDPNKEERRAIELMDMGAEALVVSGLEHTDYLLNAIEQRGIPTIATSIYQSDSQLPCIGYDNRDLGAQAARFLKERGHSRIGVIHGPLENNDRTRLRLQGAADVFPADSLISTESGMTVSAASDAAQRLLTRDARPTAVLCLSDVLALGVLFEAPKHGLKIPDDLAVMGFDDLEWAKSANPPLTSIALPVVEMGNRAAAALVDKLEFDTPLISDRLPSEIIVREST